MRTWNISSIFTLKQRDTMNSGPRYFLWNNCPSQMKNLFRYLRAFLAVWSSPSDVYRSVSSRYRVRNVANCGFLLRRYDKVSVVLCLIWGIVLSRLSWQEIGCQNASPWFLLQFKYVFCRKIHPSCQHPWTSVFSKAQCRDWWSVINWSGCSDRR